MVNIYDDIKNEIVEQIAYDLFQDCGIKADKINPGNMIDVMLMLEDQVKVDIDRSEMCVDSGELSVEFIAACEKQNENTEASKNPLNLFEKFAQKENIQITKKGKHFRANNFDYLIVFFYDCYIDAKTYDRYERPSNQPELIPNHTLLIKSDELIKHINDNSDYYFDLIQIIEKTSNPIINKVDSATIKVPVEKLKAETNCLFYKHLDINQEEVLNYLEL